jgi:hypothetical protein
MATGVKAPQRRVRARSANGQGAVDRQAGTIFFTVLTTKLTIQRFGIGNRSPTAS